MSWTRLAAFAAAVLVAACTAATVRADPLKGDPRKCVFNNPVNCAKTAAEATVKHAMAARTHIPTWDAQITCAQSGSLLRWHCTYKRAGKIGVANVRFVATSKGWLRKVTVVS